jgi:hypothetical protein
VFLAERGLLIPVARSGLRPVRALRRAWYRLLRAVRRTAQPPPSG